MGTKFINHEINYCYIQLLHLLPSYFLNFVVHTSISIFLFVLARDFPCPYIQQPNIIGWSRLLLVPTYNWHPLIAGMWHQCTIMPHLLAAALPFGAPRCHILCGLTLCNGARRCQLFRLLSCRSVHGVASSSASLGTLWPTVSFSNYGLIYTLPFCIVSFTWECQ